MKRQRTSNVAVILNIVMCIYRNVYVVLLPAGAIVVRGSSTLSSSGVKIQSVDLGFQFKSNVFNFGAAL